METSWLSSEVYFNVVAYYYHPDNSRNEYPGEHSIYVFGGMNFDDYGRPTNIDIESVYETYFSFNNIKEMKIMCEVLYVITKQFLWCY